MHNRLSSLINNKCFILNSINSAKNVSEDSNENVYLECKRFFMINHSSMVDLAFD